MVLREKGLWFIRKQFVGGLIFMVDMFSPPQF